LGQTLERLGRQDEARAAFAELEKLQRADANFAQANTQYNLGLQALAKGDLRSARNAFQDALVIKPDFAEAHTNLGGVLLKLGEVESAIGHFQAAIDLKPEDARASYNLALALEKKGDQRGAREALHRAVELDPRLAGPPPEVHP
jgi:tetratricopeptide (TPR) repeat protein